jgi:hypothetical protein
MNVPDLKEGCALDGFGRERHSLRAVRCIAL